MTTELNVPEFLPANFAIGSGILFTRKSDVPIAWFLPPILAETVTFAIVPGEFTVTVYLPFEPEILPPDIETAKFSIGIPGAETETGLGTPT